MKRELLVTFLKKAFLQLGRDCRIDTAKNGLEASHLMEHFQYDLVLCDNRMPVMKGIELFREICETESFHSFQWIWTCGEIDDVSESLKHPNVAYFEKPYRLADFKSLITDSLGA